MKLLFDENLSPQLAGLLNDLFPGSIHVRDVGLKAADDPILSAYPLSLGLSDEWHKLSDALSDIRALCRDDLATDEEKKPDWAILQIQQIVGK